MAETVGDGDEEVFGISVSVFFYRGEAGMEGRARATANGAQLRV
jgi:hypothetical protein